jgi:hypothetical protein
MARSICASLRLAAMTISREWREDRTPAEDASRPVLK